MKYWSFYYNLACGILSLHIYYYWIYWAYCTFFHLYLSFWIGLSIANYASFWWRTNWPRFVPLDPLKEHVIGDISTNVIPFWGLQWEAAMLQVCLILLPHNCLWKPLISASWKTHLSFYANQFITLLKSYNSHSLSLSLYVACYL